MLKYQLINKDKVVLEFMKTDTLEGQFKIIKEYKNETKPYLISKDSKERFNLLLVNHATSLNDTYWIREENELNFNGIPLRRYFIKKYKI